MSPDRAQQVKDDPEKYLYRCSSEVKKWIASLRKSGVKIFILTVCITRNSALNLTWIVFCDRIRTVITLRT